ncbi:aspartate carbamoyltransferase [Candidatus Falkowbacteria bacterium RIFOXYB2_FULL_34_18]|uniref:Aspartate carbamoyltransferase n=1 Tax=Candidatus Falkowbacteria bacterium RIFOXYD2_FULL_34_120 TaxID=1798007 RepID=A0A1F5TRZ2_9BACT|nr:MAG: aspartate carbamoyltransferase [Candidatus Falkowbacteria bacterium RIFOXYB2_FULL_34_18]OGF29687.1 MAG: aspartate carbamoyltransferase [Candidatus Falkowbacteria bacterium RIFOXYC12_FULL_34_55]OGF37448.1 MAG: aspartate carbamoyltransferase [Candidatus Falkowbacteria bacterium RIFOXYC2_FULL_34_220]OGF39173.1 MAG: aspartate carbamoyltransferase [Candidatus Falkowbacteria bacterium RIFOXYD12_FULL_34_57]OGF41722.1 MAG: aspartate carbamoyltransferase [Candidatus Falkowbacteria bacterium RIFO
MKNFISINDFSREEIFEKIIPGCKSMVAKAKTKKPLGWHPSKKVIFAFFEPSTRTLGSYLEASRLLGWRNMQINGAEATSLTKKESMANTVRMFAAQGADVLVMRTKIEGAQRFAAEILEADDWNTSVQNGGDGTNQHPTQTFLDLLTISEKLGRLDNFKIGFFGDLKYGRTVHSLLCALAHQKNISLKLASAPETVLQDRYKKIFKNVEEGDSLDILADCDVIYGSRLQEERFTADPVSLQRARDRFKISHKQLEMFKKDVIIMHPMPYVEEFDPQIRKDSRLIIDLQAWHGIPTRMFMLEEGYKNRKKKTLNNEKQKSEFEIITKMKLDKYMEERKSKKTVHKYFMPINNGTVIDHIPRGLGIKIREFLINKKLVGDIGVKHIIEDVPSKKQRLKNVLVLEDIFIPKETIAAISSFAPTITFNIIKNNIFQKIKIKNPSMISGIGRCPNENCITNHDGEASSKFTHHNDNLYCYYCEKEFEQREII